MRPKTKKRCLALVLACLFCGVFFVSAALTADRGHSREEEPAPASAVIPAAALAAVTAEPQPAYVLRAVGEQVFVFAAEEESVPVLRTQISLNHLRQRDREALTRGVPAADWEELLLLLEDYGS